jgi:S1-C subfamily serine protease
MRARCARVCLLGLVVGCMPAFAADDPQALQQKIDAARARLDAAARELAELHKQDTFQTQLPGPPSRASLGVLLMPGNGNGVTVAGVTPDGAAADAGLAAGDVIVSIDGTALRDANLPPIPKMFDVLRNVSPGDTVHIDYLRNGEPQSADVTASDPLPPSPGAFAVSTIAVDGGSGGSVDASPRFDVAYGVAGAPPPGAFAAALPMGGRAMVGGVELFDLDEQLGHYFGVADGVLVLRAPLDKDGGGLLAGDVVKSVGGKPVATSADCVHALAGRAATVEVVRDGATTTVEVKALHGPTLVAMPPRLSGPVSAEPSSGDVLVARPIPE